MSDISISAPSPLAMKFDDLASGVETIKDTTSEMGSGLNRGGLDTMEQAVAGVEVASRTEEFLGAGTDFSSTGTDSDIQMASQNAVDQTLSEGIGIITDTVV